MEKLDEYFSVINYSGHPVEFEIKCSEQKSEKHTLLNEETLVSVFKKDCTITFTSIFDLDGKEIMEKMTYKISQPHLLFEVFESQNSLIEIKEMIKE